MVTDLRDSRTFGQARSLHVLPTPHLLQSALRAGSLLDPTGTSVASARESYLRLPTGGLYRQEDLAAGERILVGCGLVGHEAETLYPKEELHRLLHLPEDEACRVLLSLSLAAASPLWLNTAIRDEAIFPELMPDDARTDSF